MKDVIDRVLSPIYKILGFIGSKINACPTKEDGNKCTHSPLMKENIIKKDGDHFEKKSDHLQKGDHHAKGPEHFETKRYNHPRR